jgi:hypothetical protein
MDKYYPSETSEFQHLRPRRRTRRFPVLSTLLLVALLILTFSYLFPNARLLIERLGLQKAEAPVEPSLMVWVHKDTGFYACAGSPLYGRQPGKAMFQGDALRRGFRPTAERYCTSQGSKPLSR